MIPVYFLFAGLGHYPMGGAQDYQGAFLNANAAMGRGSELMKVGPRGEMECDWAQVACWDGAWFKLVALSEPSTSCKHGQWLTPDSPEWSGAVAEFGPAGHSTGVKIA